MGLAAAAALHRTGSENGKGFGRKVGDGLGSDEAKRKLRGARLSKVRRKERATEGG